MKSLPASCSGGMTSQGGTVLIEALVAILIFSFGILGLIGLQGAMMRSQTDAKFRTDAAFLVNEFIGLAATDQANLANYATTSTTACTHTKCADWVGKVRRSLPGGNADVVYTAAGQSVSITVSWVMPDGTRHQYLAATTINN